MRAAYDLVFRMLFGACLLVLPACSNSSTDEPAKNASSSAKSEKTEKSASTPKVIQHVPLPKVPAALPRMTRRRAGLLW